MTHNLPAMLTRMKKLEDAIIAIARDLHNIAFVTGSDYAVKADMDAKRMIEELNREIES